MQEEKCLKVCTHVHVIIENNFTSRCLNLVSSAQTALIPNICESHSQDGLARVPKTYIWVRGWGGRQYFTPFFYSYFFYSIFFSKQTNITKKPPESTILKCFGSLIFALPSVERPQILQCCCHCWRVNLCSCDRIGYFYISKEVWQPPLCQPPYSP